jgi:hypothetical protein
LVEASKRKADILANQNVLMLFTAPDNENLFEDSWKYLQLRRQIELKKLRRQLANKEEMELREATRVKQAEGTTTAAVAADPADQAHAADHGDQGNDGHEHDNNHNGEDDEQGDLSNGDLTQSQRTTHNLWNSQIDPDLDPEANDVNIDVNVTRTAVL